MSDRLETHGVGVRVPRGWEAEFALQDETDRAGPTPYAASDPQVVLHLANFALPAERGDYGSGAVELMDAGGILIAVLEFDRASAGTKLFRQSGVPRELRVDAFSPDSLQRPQRNQSGCQRFFHVGDRAFCLYVVLGSHRSRQVLVPEVNRMLAGIDVA